MQPAGVLVGTLNVTGNYTQSAAGALDIELGGDSHGQYDVLFIAGGAFLDGTLRLTFVDNYQPAPGDAYELLTAASVSGVFSAPQAPSLRADISWHISYGVQSVTAMVVPAPGAFVWLAAAGLLRHRRRR